MQVRRKEILKTHNSASEPGKFFMLSLGQMVAKIYVDEGFSGRSEPQCGQVEYAGTDVLKSAKGARYITGPLWANKPAVSIFH